MKRIRSFGVGGVLTLALLALVLTAFAPGVIAAGERIDLGARLQPPGLDHWLGTDPLGRDILARLLGGTRVTLLLATSAVIAGGIFGTALGLIAGYLGGWFDRGLMRLVDMQLSLPTLLLALLIVATIGPSVTNLILILALTSWTRYARVVRGQTLSLKQQDFVLAARAIGASPPRILFRHIFPNLVGPVLALATLEVARLILIEAGLSYLGVGVPPPTASWGRMLAEGEVYVGTAWWVVTFPGLAILLSVLAINRCGEWMRANLARDQD